MQVTKEIKMDKSDGNTEKDFFQRHHQESEKTTHGMGENTCKSYI